MTQMLFVCTGNICRSAFAERYAAHLADSWPRGWQFASAGVAALAGAPMDAPMADELTARGGDPSGFVSRQLTREIIEQADLIVAMEGYHRQVVLDDHPGKVRRTFTLGQLVRTAQGAPDAQGTDLLEALGRMRGRARSGDDVADPYRRGPRAAAAAADRITELLDAVLPRLAAD